jgi:Zn-dependent peptidase ImmA (M78 family)
MVKMVRDTLLGFQKRPHYEPVELENMFEKIVSDYLKKKHGKAVFPFKTDDITTLIERDVSDLDQYADLSKYGPGVEGVTEFFHAGKPKVLIAESVHRHENRLRTTLTHEYTHVILHSYLFATGERARKVGVNQSPKAIYCQSDNMISERKVDWMEWQAGFGSGACLMPKSYVHSAVDPIRSRGGAYGVVDPQSEMGQQIIDTVVERFEVSRHAATVRLKILGFLGAEARTLPLFT